MTTLYVPIDRSAGIALHRQVYEGLRRAILGGMLRPGQRIPSSRALAIDLGLSRQPVLVAYDQLFHEGYLDGRHGSGTFVSAALPDDLLRSTGPEESGSRASAARRPSPGSPRHPPVENDSSGLGPFRMSLPALDLFPQTVWSRILARHARASTPEQQAYGDPAGLMPLREAIAEHLRTSRAVKCEPEQVLIVSGSQAALRLAAAVLLERGDRVAMEEPGYPGAHAALSAGGTEPVPVPVDEEGIGIELLRRLRGRVCAAYVTPSHQYPLGTTMTAARRFALLDWADRHGAWLLEDDYDSEYRYVSRPLGALQGLDAHDRVIYIGTFSKVLFPAVRVGYLVVPHSLVRRFVEARRAFDLFSPTLYQLTLAEFLREGHFGRHLRRMRGVYLERRDALISGLREHCANYLAVHNADAGLHIAALLTGALVDGEVVDQMARRGLAATALSTCYFGPDPRSGLLLGFGGSSEVHLLEATRVLGDVFRDLA